MERQVEFDSNGTTIVGTFQYPKSEAPSPACLLVGGGGPQLRDGSFDYSRKDYFPNPLSQRPILEIEARALEAKGVASLRYDKRGSGESGGDILTAGFSHLTDDAESALSYLVGLPETDDLHVGVLGQSEGAAVALILAARLPTVAFYVWQSGFVEDYEKLAASQPQDMENLPSDFLERMKAVAPYFYWEGISQLEILEAARAGQKSFKMGDEKWSLEVGLDYYRELLDLDLSEEISRVQSPVLLVHGESDSTVPVEHARLAYSILEASGNEQVTLEILPGIGHSMNKVDDGPPSAPPSEIIPEPSAIDLITNWISDVVTRR